MSQKKWKVFYFTNQNKIIKFNQHFLLSFFGYCEALFQIETYVYLLPKKITNDLQLIYYHTLAKDRQLSSLLLGDACLENWIS